MKALIALEDGTCFQAEAFAGRGEVYGELVFNTVHDRLPGDPHRSLVPRADRDPHLPADRQLRHQRRGRGVAPSRMPRAWWSANAAASGSNWRARQSLPDYLEDHGVLGRPPGRHPGHHPAHPLPGRHEVRGLHRGSRPGVAGGQGQGVARPGGPRPGRREVTTTEPYVWPRGGLGETARFRVAVLDCGIKCNQLRILEAAGLRMPMSSPAPPSRRRSWRSSPTASSSPTARATPRACRRRWSRTSGRSSRRGPRPSASASATRCSAWPSAARPSS